MKNKKLIDILNGSVSYLEKHSIENAKIDAELIIAYILGIRRIDIYLHFEKPISDDEISKIKEMLNLRAKKRIPVQYIIKSEGFYGNEFFVDENVLIPRPETEILVEYCIDIVKEIDEPKILDIGTGSGAIAISIGKEIPKAKVLAIDFSEEALKIAEQNSINNSVSNVKFVSSNIFSNVSYKNFDLIVSNPPYIPINEYNNLMPEVKNYEPKNALVAEENGLFFYNNIINRAKSHLKSGGFLAFEVGYSQSKKVFNMMKEKSYKNIKIYSDYSDIERVVIGEK